MNGVWDYDPKKLAKTKSGRLKLLERMINYGPPKGKKIKLSEVKKNWKKLDLFEPYRRVLELLIWGRYQSSPKSKKLF